jgi:hypothetical protein
MRSCSNQLVLMEFVQFALAVQVVRKARGEGRRPQEAGIVAAFKAGIAVNKIFGFEEGLQLLDSLFVAPP